ncbi:MAG: hypothetical protein AMK73_06820 [Planctomycetes bacterium SM23_32]|nr:MAG: hypothetical protein AMK73_06820 [Planctomycetes bacterium SM23_32]
MTEFIGDEIEVRRSRESGLPASFAWRGREYEVADVERRWRSFDFRKTWWRRRHRDHYVVETTTCERLELYFHRGPGRKYWVLYRRLDR